MDAQKRVNELKAANAVRKLVARVRKADPDTIDALEIELFEGLEKQHENLGSLHAKVQEEVEKALDFARTQVAQMTERRAEEEISAERPQELIEEIQQLMAELQGRLRGLRETAQLEGPHRGRALEVDDAEIVRRMAEECSAEVKIFSQACVERATEIKETPLPPLLKETWNALAHEIVEVKRKAEMSVASARTAASKATEALRKEQVEEMKAGLRDKIKDSMASLPPAFDSMAQAEQLVEPFIYGHPLPDHEMQALAERVEAAVAEAESAVSHARREIRPLGQDAFSGFGNVDALVKKELRAWITTEEKVPRIRLGQLDRRIARIHIIVGRWRSERSTMKDHAVIEEAKQELVAKLQAAADSPVVEAVEPALKLAEKAIEPCSKHRTMPMEQMTEIQAQASEAIGAAKAALDAANEDLCPIDESLDEEVKAKLRAAAAPHLKKHQVKLGQFERRLVRAQNLLATFKGELDKKRFSEHEAERQAMRKVVRFHLKTHEMSSDALYETIATQSADSAVIDKTAFLAFFVHAEMTVKKPGSEEEETLELPQDILAKIFDSHAGSEDAVNKESFEKMMGSSMVVAKATTLTTSLTISEGKVVRALRGGELLEYLDGPLPEPKAGMLRVKVRCKKDEAVGWASMTGNAGTIFLQES